ncbi:PIN-like domain-containing protein [Empedobacter falsenii]
MSTVDLISDEFSFKAKREIQSLGEYWECLKKFDKESKEISNKRGNYPIFVDTNFLLKYYEISLESRKNLFKFIDNNKERIFITKHVQKEFIKNREKTIKGFNSSKIKPTIKSFDEVIGKLNHFKNQAKHIINDQKDITKKLDKIDKDFDSLKKLFEDDFQKKYQFDIFSNDEYVDLILTCNILEELHEEELKVILKHFSDFNNSLNTLPIEKHPDLRFPGCGDIGKERNKEGDFIIYHEILKQLKELNSSVIFLTYDSAKSDWFHSDKKTVMHYVYNSYNNTNHILHIIDAERYLPDIYNIEFIEEFSSIEYIKFQNFFNLNESNKIKITSKKQDDFKMSFHTFSIIKVLSNNGIKINISDSLQYEEIIKRISTLLINNDLTILQFEKHVIFNKRIQLLKDIIDNIDLLEEIVNQLDIFITNHKILKS